MLSANSPKKYLPNDQRVSEDGKRQIYSGSEWLQTGDEVEYRGIVGRIISYGASRFAVKLETGETKNILASNLRKLPPALSEVA